MLDSHEETDGVMTGRRRCRSFDALSPPRDGPDTVVWLADDVVDDGGDHTGRPRRQPSGGGGGSGSGELGSGRCVSASDLLTAGDDDQQADDYDPSWCSVNNLETDCVSPRVSSNSLFSQLDAGTAASSDEVGENPPSSTSHLHAAADASTSARATSGGCRTPSSTVCDEQPMYTRHSRRIPFQATTQGSSQPPTMLLLRQLKAAAAGGACSTRPAVLVHDGRRSSMAEATRSLSCPSLVYDRRQHQEEPDCVKAAVEHGVNGRDEQVRDASMDGILAPVSIIAHSTGSGARAPMQWLTALPTRRSASPPLATSSVPDTSTSVCARRTFDDAGRKTRQRGSSSAMTTDRATRRLARTKCLQWLNSFDEDD